MRPYDWQEKCPLDFARPFPPIVGRGRGYVMGKSPRRGAEGEPITRAEFVRRIVAALDWECRVSDD